MGTFDWHSDITELDGMRGPGGLAAHGLYVLTGAWTGSHGRTGIVPDEIAEEMSRGDEDAITRLIRAGLWERCEGGYRMLRGPSADPDLPMPLWRYSDDDLGRRLFALDPTPNN
jgi:hypothetical protein